MVIAWSIGGLFFLAFASFLPYGLIIRRVNPIPLNGILVLIPILMVFSGLPFGVAMALFFQSFCVIELSVEPGKILRQKRMFFVRIEKRFDVDGAYLDRKWYVSRHGGQYVEVLYVRHSTGKKLLMDALSCSNLEAALSWIFENAKVETFDYRPPQ